ncbi:MAG: hypothetical protein SGJ00_00375 [bacterium]|nr:hypothetical protein [bacterium]
MKILKLLILCLINFLALVWPPKSLNSCGFSIYKEEYRFWTFDPNLHAQSGMLPLFYSMDFYHKGFKENAYYAVDDSELESVDDYEQNVLQWKNYCLRLDPKNKVQVGDIYDVLYRTNPGDFFAIYEGLVKGNSFVAFANKHPAIKSYLALAKRAEYQLSSGVSWDCPDCPVIKYQQIILPQRNRYYNSDNGIRIEPNKVAKIIEEATQNRLQIQDVFLKQRYAFQLLRLGFYTTDSTLMAQNYHAYLEVLPNDNWLKNSAMMYAVTSYPNAERNYQLSKIFEACPNLRYTCEKAYQNEFTQQALSYAKNDHERAMILFLDATHRPSEKLDAIEEILHLDLSNKFLPGLWLREINKIEDWILGTKYCEFGSTRKEDFFYKFGWDQPQLVNQAINAQFNKDKAYAKRVYAFLNENMAVLGRTNNAFYHLCAGYLAFILMDLDASAKHYALVDAKQLDEIGKTQFLLSGFMLEIAKSERITEQVKQEFARLNNYLLATSNKYPQRKEMRFQLINFVAREFIQRGAAPEGFLLYGFSAKPYATHNLLGIGNMYTNLYKNASPENILAMIHLLNKHNASDFEKLLRGKVYTYTYESYDEDESNLEYINKDKLYDICSMKLVQQDRLVDALEVLKLIDTGYWNNEVYTQFKMDDPFWVSPNNGHDPLNFRNCSYNKVSFLRELIQLKNRVPKLNKEQKALALYKIGNAYYSMSYHGKYWIMQKNYQLGDYEEDNDLDVDPMYYSAARSRYYFKEALKYSYEPKLLALILFMLNNGYYELPGRRDKLFPMKILKEKKVNPDFYEQLSGNCALFYEFIKTYN